MPWVNIGPELWTIEEYLALATSQNLYYVEIQYTFFSSGPDAQTSISKYLARYPLTGHSRVKLVLEKNDLKGYHIRGVVRSEGGRDSFELLFDAEGKIFKMPHNF